MKPYNHLPGYLHRWSVLKFWRFFVRVHDILTPDGTPFLHNHPFAYVTIPLSGGYVEQVIGPKTGWREVESIHVKKWRPHFSGPGRYHRIASVEPGTRTLFIGFRVHRPWKLIRHALITAPASYEDDKDGIYPFTGGYRKRQFGRWYALCSTAEDAAKCTQLSIHQSIHRQV